MAYASLISSERQWQVQENNLDVLVTSVKAQGISLWSPSIEIQYYTSLFAVARVKYLQLVSGK